MKTHTAFVFDLAAQSINCVGYFSPKATGRSLRREADRKWRKAAKKQGTGVRA